MPVISGVSKACNIVYGQSCDIKLSKTQIEHIRMRFFAPKFVYAPTLRGQAVGCVQFELHGFILAEVPLYFEKTIAEEAIEKNGNFWSFLFGIDSTEA